MLRDATGKQPGSNRDAERVRSPPMTTMFTELRKLVQLDKWCHDGTARKRRLDHHITLRQIGDAIDTAPSTIHRWENGFTPARGNKAIAYHQLLTSLGENK